MKRTWRRNCRKKWKKLLAKMFFQKFFQADLGFAKNCGQCTFGDVFEMNWDNGAVASIRVIHNQMTAGLVIFDKT